MIKPIRFLSAIAFAVCALAPQQIRAQDWGCYDPKPGHPTAEEKAAFIAQVSELAVEAEQKHGVPAAALAAMAMEETGLGWTRITLEANNFFGWK